MLEWNEISTLMANQLIMLNKYPGIRPLGIKECLHRVLGKCLVLTTGMDVQSTYGVEQLCSGIMAGIEGVVNAM